MNSNPALTDSWLPKRLRAAAAWLVIAACGGCTNAIFGPSLDIRLNRITPDPLLLDVTTMAVFFADITIDYDLIGTASAKSRSSCGPFRFSSTLAGVSGSLSMLAAAASDCVVEGNRTGITRLFVDSTVLATQASGTYPARVELSRCYDDLGAGGPRCTTTQREFMIELRSQTPPQAPSPAQNLAAAVDGNTIVLNWTLARGAQSYLLERQSGGAAFTPLASPDAFTTSFRDISALPNTPYVYRLTAINNTGSSAPALANAQIGVARQLRVTVEARGDSVSSDIPGINCTGPGSCSASYLLNSVVTLTATAQAGSRLVRWTGDADCSDGVVTMDADKNCTATFTSFDDKAVTLTVNGNGRVTSQAAGIACPGQCSSLFTLLSSVFLSATPSPGWVFVRWTGDADCGDGILEMNADKTCAAEFAPTPGTTQMLTVYVQGTGSVSALPAGLVCIPGAASCSGRFARGQVVTLTATPGANNVFSGWAGSPDCSDGQVTMSADLVCVANFVSTAATWVTGAAALNQGSQFVAARMLEPAISVDAAGQPVVAWTEDGVVRVYRPTAGGVTQVSVSAVNGKPSLVMEPSDQPLVAFAEETTAERRNVRLRRYSPAAGWADVGPGALDTVLTADAWDPCVVIRNGRITVAWVEGEPGAGSRVVVRSWDGVQWSAVGNGSGPAPSAAGSESQQPRLVVTGTAGSQSLALLWGEDFQTLRVAELVGNDWIPTAAAPYAGAVQPERADMMWVAGLGLVVAAAPASGANLVVRQWSQGQWSDVGSPRGDTTPSAFVLALAFSHGSADATPLLALAISRANGAGQETVVERFVGGSWIRLGTVLPAIDRHRRGASPRAVAVADHAQPEAAVVLQGVVPGTISADHTLAVLRFE